MTNQNRIRIAIQKSGRLNEASLNFITDCGIKVSTHKEQLFCHSDNFPLDVLFVRDDDIPNLIASGFCDFGIVGSNVLQEQAFGKNVPSTTYNLEIVSNLGFALCRLSLAVPEQFNYQSINTLKNCKIATSYPNILENFLKQKNLNINIVPFSGSVEIAPRLGIADAICDLVSTGRTLKSNNLREVEVVFKSEAALIQAKRLCSKEKRAILQIFLDRISTQEACYA